MEYVKDAIEKARLERERMGLAPEDSSEQPEKEQQREALQKTAGRAKADRKPAAKPATTDKHSEGIHVEYSQTRRVKVSNQVLLDNRIVSAFESDHRAEPYRQLRTLVLKRFAEKNWRTLAITSAHRHAGKTLTAVNLAISLSKDMNQTILLADMDLKGPNILDALGVTVDKGLVEHLMQGVPLADILVNPGFDRLTVLPATPVAGDTSEILSSPAMKETLGELVNRYNDRLIVFDLPPLLADDDALVFAPYVDATLLVVESGVTTPEELKRCYQLLEGTPIIGTILNKV